MKLKDRIVIVTGGGTGIGRGISESFAAEGAKVFVNYQSSRAEAEETAAAICAAGGEAHPYQASVVVEEEVKRMFADIWDRTLNTNLRGAFYCMRAAAPYLAKRPGSSVVNIASIAPYSGQGSSIVYAASKAGLISMTKSFARILAPGIRVNAIAPGFVRTRFAGWPKETFDEAEKTTPLRRIATPLEIGAAAVFLAADATAITGETINVDVGQTAIGRTV
jgi:3-oxoacyl-[acyl-carrier protein] reductase